MHLRTYLFLGFLEGVTQRRALGEGFNSVAISWSEKRYKKFFWGKLSKAFYQDLLRRHQAEAAVRAELKLEDHVIVVPHRRAVGGQRRLPVEPLAAPKHLQDGAVVAPCAVASGAVAEVRVPLRAVAAERAGADGPEVGELVLQAVAGVDVAAAASADSGALGRVLNKEKVFFSAPAKAYNFLKNFGYIF